MSWYSIAKGWCSARSRKLPSGYRKCSDRSLLLFWVSSGERWSERRSQGKDRERLSPGEIKWGQERTQIMHEREQKSGRERKRSQIRFGGAICLEREQQEEDKEDRYEWRGRHRSGDGLELWQDCLLTVRSVLPTLNAQTLKARVSIGFNLLDYIVFSVELIWGRRSS